MTRFPCCCAAVLALSLLSACAPPIARPVLQPDLPAAWEPRPEEGNAANPALDQWWRALDDPVLDDLVQRALAGNLDIAVAKARLRAAREMRGPVDAAYRPQLALSAGGIPSADSRTGYFQGGFDATWELGLFGAGESASSVAAAEEGLAQADLSAARVSLVAEVARTYLELRAAERRELLLADETATQAERLQMMQVQLRHRLIADDELRRAQAAATQFEANAWEPKAATARCRQQLLLLLGDRNAALPAPLQNADAPSADLGGLRVEQMPSDLLRTRPEIRRAEQQVLKAAGEAGVARSQLYPKLGLGGLMSYAAAYSGVHRRSVLNNVWVLGPAIDMPLFDWGAREAELRARHAELDAALAGYRRSVLEGVVEVQTALLQLHLQHERVAAMRRASQAVEQQEAAAAARQRLRLGDGLEKAAARGTLLQAQQELAQAQLGEQLAFVALYKALGGAALPAKGTRLPAAPGETP